MGTSQDPRGLTMNNKHLTSPKYNYETVNQPNTDLFMYTQPPFMSPKTKDEAFQYNGDPQYKVDSGNEAHFVFTKGTIGIDGGSSGSNSAASTHDFLNDILNIRAGNFFVFIGCW